MTQARIDRMLDDVRITIASHGKIVVLSAAAALAAVVVAVTSIMSPELTAGETESELPPAAHFGVVPSQHVNQAAEANEQSQTF